MRNTSIDAEMMVNKLPSFKEMDKNSSINSNKLTAVCLLILGLTSCSNEEFVATPPVEFIPPQEPVIQTISVDALRFVGEAVIPQGLDFEGTTVGGLSSIDYINGQYFMISDDQGADTDDLAGPVRFYTATIDFDTQGINDVEISAVTEILDESGESFAGGEADPESLRFDNVSGNIIWTSEGFVNNGVDPFVREMTPEGNYVRDLSVPDMFLVNASEGEGPRNNTSFEGASVSIDGNGYWVAMEGPLVQDGDEPGFQDVSSPVRVAFINRESGEFGRQFAIELDAVQRLPAQPGFQFSVNGLVEILEYNNDRFLMIERSFATNYVDGGNNVKIYDIDATQATDIASMATLEGADFVPATKTELFDFETIRSQLTSNMVDNIEGITFGPNLENGNPSLILIADDNFALFSPQVNQVLVFEVLAVAPSPAPVETAISSLTFIGEQVLAPEEFISSDNQMSTIGGLSGIDYQNGVYYLISDDNNADDAVNGPVRFYTAELTFDENSFTNVSITGVTELNSGISDAGSIVPFAALQADPEGLRVDPNNGNIIWINEGRINDGIAPSVSEAGTSGEIVRDMNLPLLFDVNTDMPDVGPRNNVAFEGISINTEETGFWVATEGPLRQDGPEASLGDTFSPIRVALIDRETGEFGRQFAYDLDSVTNREGADSAFTVNGVVDILEYAPNQFLFLERSFVSAQADGGNDVKLYRVDASQATDVSDLDALENAMFEVASKELLLDFNDIRDQLTAINGANVVDNLEGMTFGPRLANGNRSLVIVADNNFNAFGPQLNQFLVFQVNP